MARRLVESSRVEGTAVMGRDHVKVGTVADLMIDKRRGQVAYAIVSVGGFLGVGEKYIALPWAVLDYDPQDDAFVVDMPSETLESAPGFDRDNPPDLEEPGQAEAVHAHYGCPGCWYEEVVVVEMGR